MGSVLGLERADAGTRPRAEDRDPSGGRSPFDEADPAVLRAMIELGGRVLDDLAGDVPPARTLRDLCDSCRAVLDAGRVTVELGGAVDATFRAEAVRPEEADGSPEISYRRAITGPDGQSLGWLEAAWPADDGRPNPLDRLVVERFSRLAVLIVERHNARRQQLQALAQDRQDLAGEIHDDPIQTMTAVALRLQRVQPKLGDGPERQAVAEARALTDQAIERLRQVMFSLHPATLDEDGLAATLEAYAETYLEPEGLVCEVTAAGEEPVPAEIAALAFRLARGALVNVVKHARASRVQVRLSAAGGLVRLTVIDDGIGFDTEALSHTPVGHFGIPHARSLARSAGGSYITSSEPGRGTTVTIELPLS